MKKNDVIIGCLPTQRYASQTTALVACVSFLINTRFPAFLSFYQKSPGHFGGPYTIAENLKTSFSDYGTTDTDALKDAGRILPEMMKLAHHQR